MTKKRNTICALCGGIKKESTTTFTADINSGVIVVRNVPATVCSQCGQHIYLKTLLRMQKKSIVSLRS